MFKLGWVLGFALMAQLTVAVNMQTGGPLMAVDALGRKTPDSSIAPSPRQNRQVGIFYFLWLGEHGRGKPLDVSKILAADPQAGYKPDSPVWGGIGTYHHWGEPFYGYYYSDDEWVVRHHLKLLIQADVDFLFFDTTNAVIYEKNAKLVMRILEEYFQAGWKTPKVMFYTNTKSGATAQRIYESVYRPGFCRDTWFVFEGRPVIIAVESECSPEVRAFFNIKMSQWPNEPTKKGGWPWMDFTRPQRVFENQRGEPEVINVSVAQHPQLRFGDSAMYGEKGNRGRAFHNGENDPAPNAYLHGYNFSEQFERAIETDPPVVLITGWNEWIMGRWRGTPERPILFVDCANYEYSRDIEMMRGGYFDNYFMQLVGFIRRYKGIVTTPTHAFDGPAAVYDNFADGDFARHAPGYGTVYENRTQRNAIRRVEVRHNRESLFFTIRTKRPVSGPGTGGTWLKIYLNFSGGTGYDYVLNNTPGANGETTLARIKSAGESLSCADLPESKLRYAVDGDKFSVSLPLAAVGVTKPDFTLWFKVADSTEEIKTVADFYDRGDAAPLGRLNYVYIAR
ncbi:MAG: hypothetical protein IJU44_09675 [Kiritimatiellae bacterium]|nr:hypothetical protein [Kiritimatiellia bacterium]